MIDPKVKIKSSLQQAVKELTGQEVDVKLESPSDSLHGDYSSNVAMILAKQVQKKPMDLAQEIVELLKTTHKIAHIEQVEAVMPGFINFSLVKDFLVSSANRVLMNEKRIDMVTQSKKDKRVVVEFTDPNPFKEFHIGHLYSNTVGEALSRLFEVEGATVRRVCYQGDVGLHVAKALWGMIQQFEEKEGKFKGLEELEKASLTERIQFMGQGYTLGDKAFQESEELKKEIAELNKKIYERDASIKDLYDTGKKWSLEYFETIYKRLGTQFEGYYFESEVGKIGLEYVKEHLKAGIFEEHDGAVIFPGKNYGLHNRVFINSLGLPTYEAKELGLAPKKYEDFPYDESVIVTGNEITEYFRVLLKALSLINKDLADKTRHIGHGMVRLPSGKMSSRTGNVLTGEWLLDEAKNIMKNTYKDMDEKTLEVVAIGAVKYGLLKSSIGKDTVFDFHESISLEGNSGPYLQYTYVRTQSVLRKKEARISDFSLVDGEKLQKKSEIDILRHLVKFDDVVGLATEQFAPNLLCNYLFELSQKFNLFYQECPIIGSQEENERLALTAAVGKVLKEGLYLLGIAVPEKM